MNRCQYCGSNNNAVSSCSKCAAPLPEVKYAYPPAPRYTVTKASIKDFAPYFVGILLIAGLILGTIYLKGKKAVSEIAIPAPVAYTLNEAGTVSNYKYSVKREGEKSVALFYPIMIPRNDEIMIAATNKVIWHAYGEKTIGTPKPDGIQLRYFGETHNFMVTIIKEETGEIHTLVIERVRR